MNSTTQQSSRATDANHEALPYVSIAVACRNEERFIYHFLTGVADQSYPLDRIEVVVADGQSTDRTREKIREFQVARPELRVVVVENTERVTPAGFNAAIQNSSGDLILPIGAHSELSPRYIEGCVAYLRDFPDADVVGGSLQTLPTNDSLMAVAIAESLSHPFGTGNAAFRLGVTEPKWVDTVFGGCYRRKVLEEVGLYNSDLLRSQDLELNLRIAQSGHKLLLAPGLEMKYYPKSGWWDIAKYYFRAGIWVSWSRRFTNVNYRLRQYLPLLAVSCGLALLAAALVVPVVRWVAVPLLFMYLGLNFFVSTKVAFHKKRWGLLWALPVAFTTRHLMFGAGSLVGLLLLVAAAAKPAKPSPAAVLPPLTKQLPRMNQNAAR